MIFKKDFGSLTSKSLNNLLSKTNITNTNIGGIARSLIEVVNLNISDYYDILDINTAMGFVSSAEGYFLDLIADLFNLTRITPSTASVNATDNVQKFYVATGYLIDRLPAGVIPQGTTVSTTDNSVVFTVSADAPFDSSATYVYASISANTPGSLSNVGVNTLVNNSLGISDVFTTNEQIISGGTDLESDDNFRYRIINASVSAEKANETSIRLAALSVPGVADVIVHPYSRGIGTYDVIVTPTEGIATSGLIGMVQTAIDSVTAFGIKGTAIAPTIVPVYLEIQLVFVNGATDTDKTNIRNGVTTAVENYIVNIPVGGEFVLNKLREVIMDVDNKIQDHTINCYYFRGQPTFLGNVSISWDEMFYPDPSMAQAIVVI